MFKLVCKIFFICSVTLSTSLYPKDITSLIPDLTQDGVWVQFQYGLNLSDAQSREIMFRFRAYDKTKHQLIKSRIYVESKLLKHYALDYQDQSKVESYTKALYKVRTQLSDLDLDFFFELKNVLTKEQFDMYLGYTFSKKKEPVIAYTHGHKTSIKY